jgi:hypothetical protein
MSDKQQTIPDFWIAWGGPAAWPDESRPPTLRQVSDIDTPIVFKRPEKAHLCRLANRGEDEDFTHRDRKCRFVTEDDFPAAADRFIYLRGRLDPTKGDPIGVLRQIAVFAGLIPSPGHEGAMRLWPDEISDRGRLVYLYNQHMIRVDAVTVLVDEIIIEEQGEPE